jgi:light-regulated signal transduction histidine kinase (bacteriophytochrome)
VDTRFSTTVSLACHDLRTPLATVSGFAKTLHRTEGLDDRSNQFAAMIDAAADELATLLDELGLLARIEGGRYEPALADADTLTLATSTDERISTVGTGESIQTDAPAVTRSLEALAIAAARYGGIDRVSWMVNGRNLRLAPVAAEAAPVVSAADVRDFGSVVARRVIEALGGSLAIDGETLLVSL